MEVSVRLRKYYAHISPKRTRSCGCIQRESIRRIALASRQANPISRTKEYRAGIKRKIMADPAKYLHSKVSRLLCHSLKSVGAIKTSATFDMLGYTPQQLRDHIERQFTNGMSWENRHLWEIDHIRPISSAQTLQDVINLNHLTNLRPLWSEDNNKKKNRREYLI